MKQRLHGGSTPVVVPTILDKWEVQIRQMGREKTIMIKTVLFFCHFNHLLSA
jgi:hypothetical protein